MSYLHVGPALYADRRQGAQIIQRGPHGHRFSADPLALRLAQGNHGQGLTWWKTQMDQAGDYSGFWQPVQEVVGVMGMSGLPPIPGLPGVKSNLAKLGLALGAVALAFGATKRIL